jgi:hypothetical protein
LILHNSNEAYLMAANRPIIVVTGGNRGIGFEVCRQLAERGAQVILTAPHPEAGEEAVKKLAAGKLAAQFHPLNMRAALPPCAIICSGGSAASMCSLTMRASTPTRTAPGSKSGWKSCARLSKRIRWLPCICRNCWRLY